MREKLKKLREEKNLTVDELSGVFNISSSHLYKIEAGIRNPNMNLAKKIADYFETEIEEIFFDNEMGKTSNEIYTA